MMRLKKFPSTLPSGLGVTKSGRLQIPLKWNGYSIKEKPDDISCYGQPMPKVGDKVAVIAHGGLITKKNLGIVTGTGILMDRETVEVILRTGETTSDWLDSLYVLTDEELLDALEYFEAKSK